MDDSQFHRKYISKNIREMENEQKVKNFPLYIKRCQFIYDNYANKKKYTLIKFWEIALNLTVSKPYIPVEALNSKYRKIANNNKLADKCVNKEFVYLYNNFSYNIKSLYPKKKIIQSLKTFLKEKNPISFKQFFTEFFPSCFLSDKKEGDIYVSTKFAMGYYDKYVKSGLSFKEFDTEMSL